MALTEAMDLSDVEMKCRSLVHQMIVPVIKLAQTNVEYNASKNECIKKLEHEIETLKSRLLGNDRNISSMPKIVNRIALGEIK